MSGRARMRLASRAAGAPAGASRITTRTRRRPCAPAGRRRLARGFTLVEVLVALAIVAIGMSAVLGALGSSAETAAYLRDKTLAEWIALNQLAQARLQTQMPAKGGTDGELDYAGRHWRWHQEVVDGGFPGILRIDVTVQQADTAAGKNAPWIASVSGAMGNAVAPPQTTSVYNEFAQLPPGAGGLNGGNGSSGAPGFGGPGTATITPLGGTSQSTTSGSTLGGR